MRAKESHLGPEKGTYQIKDEEPGTQMTNYLLHKMGDYVHVIQIRRYPESISQSGTGVTDFDIGMFDYDPRIPKPTAPTMANTPHATPTSVAILTPPNSRLGVVPIARPF